MMTVAACDRRIRDERQQLMEDKKFLQHALTKANDRVALFTTGLLTLVVGILGGKLFGAL